jgi:hypothetical protein
MLKTCKSCKLQAEQIQFPQFKRRGVYSHRNFCFTCWGKRKLLMDAAYRAFKNGLEFSIGIEHIVIPPLCPILKIPLSFTDRGISNSPSLDRIDSRRGYTQDNVQIISARANHLKRDATLDELMALGDFAIKYSIEKGLV